MYNVFKVFVTFVGMVGSVLGLMYVLGVIGGYSEPLMIIAILPLLFFVCALNSILVAWANGW